MGRKDLSFLHNITDEDKIFLNKLVDWTEFAREKYSLKFSGFLDERMCALSKAVLSSVRWENYVFWGGYDEAERQMLCVYPEYEEISKEDFPMEIVEFSYRAADKLTHRDFLGALMSLQIKRDCVGDILVTEGKAQVFLKDQAAQLAMENIRKIGRVGVKLSLGAQELLVPKPDFEQINGVVSTLRIDSVVSVMLKISRAKASAAIKNGTVSVNHFPCESTDKVLCEGDKLSIRGRGKFLLSSVGGVTKKDKIHITVLKYI